MTDDVSSNLEIFAVSIRLVTRASVLTSVLLTPSAVLATSAPGSAPVPVTVQNFNRAETDMYFANFAKQGAFRKFYHNRTVAPIEKQDVIRMNRDTLYSAAVFDLDAGPATSPSPTPASAAWRS